MNTLNFLERTDFPLATDWLQRVADNTQMLEKALAALIGRYAGATAAILSGCEITFTESENSMDEIVDHVSVAEGVAMIGGRIVRVLPSQFDMGEQPYGGNLALFLFLRDEQVSALGQTYTPNREYAAGVHISGGSYAPEGYTFVTSVYWDEVAWYTVAQQV